MLNYTAVNQQVLESIPVAARKILDLGCGTGSLGAELKRRHPGVKITGVTFSESEAALARGVLDNVIVADLDRFDFLELDGGFDCVICSHVLEHLTRGNELLIRLRAALPDALLVTALPNVLHWRQRIQFLAGRFRYTQGGVMDSTHFRFYDWRTARALFEEAGWKPVKFFATGNLPLPLIRKILPMSLGSTLDHLACLLAPGLFGAQFIAVCRSK